MALLKSTATIPSVVRIETAAQRNNSDRMPHSLSRTSDAERCSDEVAFESVASEEEVEAVDI